MPQIGQAPGASRTISGCIGQVHSVAGLELKPLAARPRLSGRNRAGGQKAFGIALEAVAASRIAKWHFLPLRDDVAAACWLVDVIPHTGSMCHAACRGSASQLSYNRLPGSPRPAHTHGVQPMGSDEDVFSAVSGDRGGRDSVGHPANSRPGWVAAGHGQRRLDALHGRRSRAAATRRSTQITGANFSKLEVAWRFKTDNLGTRPEYKLEGTPLAIRGIVYATGGTRRSVVSLDGATGEIRWVHSYREGQRAVAAPRQLSGRGLSY